MKKILLLLAAVVVISCVRKSQEQTQNGDFNVEFLFEQDGCRVYRFKDAGRYIYWSNCAGRTQYTEVHSNGKSRYSHEVQSFTTK